MWNSASQSRGRHAVSVASAPGSYVQSLQTVFSFGFVDGLSRSRIAWNNT